MKTNPENIAQQMIDMQKAALSSFTDAATLAQNQAAQTVKMSLDQATWIPDQGRQAILSWMMRRSSSSSSSGLESTSMRRREPASSIRSIALSGRNRSVM